MFFFGRKINENEKDLPFSAENENEKYIIHNKYQEQHVLCNQLSFNCVSLILYVYT